MKGGTSSLHYYLNLHPDIYMSQPKELDFFVREGNYKNGLEWYKSIFPDYVSVRGESSPSYSKYPAYDDVPKRMHSVLPNVKLVYILRDPVDRIVSHYVHNLAHGRERRTIQDALTPIENNHYVACSKYYLQLTRYLEYFHMENILIIKSEALKSNRTCTLERIFRFLGVDESFVSDQYGTMLHNSGGKRRYSSVGRYLKDLPVVRRAAAIMPRSLTRGIYRVVSSELEKVTLPEALRRELVEYLEEDVDSLRKVTELEFVEWCV